MVERAVSSPDLASMLPTRPQADFAKAKTDLARALQRPCRLGTSPRQLVGEVAMLLPEGAPGHFAARAEAESEVAKETPRSSFLVLDPSEKVAGTSLLLPTLSLSLPESDTATQQDWEDTTTQQEDLLIPSAVDLKRLHTAKKEQEQRLQSLQARVKLLNTREQGVWKDVKLTQQMSQQTQEAQRRKKLQEQARLRADREEWARKGEKQIRTQDMRTARDANRSQPRLQKYAENQAIANEVRENSRKVAAIIEETREQTRQNKAMQVALRRQTNRQPKLQRELAVTCQVQAKQDLTAMKYSQLHEDMQSIEAAIAKAEREETLAMSRLQNSQQVRSTVFSQLKAQVVIADGAGSVPMSPAKAGTATRRLSPRSPGSASSPRLPAFVPSPRLPMPATRESAVRRCQSARTL
jgi:hypothetical protein